MFLRHSIETKGTVSKANIFLRGILNILLENRKRIIVTTNLENGILGKIMYSLKIEKKIANLITFIPKQFNLSSATLC